MLRNLKVFRLRSFHQLRLELKVPHGLRCRVWGLYVKIEILPGSPIWLIVMEYTLKHIRNRRVIQGIFLKAY